MQNDFYKAKINIICCEKHGVFALQTITLRFMQAKKNICVFCASSGRVARPYSAAARASGQILAEAGYGIVYGGGAVGLMGEVAAGALAAGGRVLGIIPEFMVELEWAHPHLSELVVTQTMAERKSKMREMSDAVLTLPGGTGTLEEMLEVMTLKRLGLYPNPIILLNCENFFALFIRFYEQMIAEHFLDHRHREIFTLCQSVSEILPGLEAARPWTEDVRQYARVKGHAEAPLASPNLPSTEED
jgi:uncharacterized protein (TIGR00730 family)